MVVFSYKTYSTNELESLPRVVTHENGACRDTLTVTVSLFIVQVVQKDVVQLEGQGLQSLHVFLGAVVGIEIYSVATNPVVP